MPTPAFADPVPIGLMLTCRLCGLGGGTLRKLKDSRGVEGLAHWQGNKEIPRPCIRTAIKRAVGSAEERQKALEDVTAALLRAGWNGKELTRMLREEA